MLCEACGSTIPDDAATCPECGVSTSLFLVKPALQTVTQTVPDFVKTPGSQQVASATSETPEGSTIQQPAAQGTAKKANVFAYISLFLGIIALILVILSARGNSGTVSLFEYAFFALFADIVFSIIGFIKSMSIKESKPIAIAGLIICIIDFIITLLVFALIVWPIMYQMFYQFTHSGPF